MQLSVVIVNYNVKYFLEQVLYSVFNALQGIEGEVFVVDNNSADGSCDMVKRKFPQVNLIENQVNTGFSKANNQAIKLAKGKYVLLLNPDTVVEEDCFKQCLAFMENTPDAGGLGVKMIDGKGKFLPESKRGLPTPMVAFYKMSGLASLFPTSKKFGAYHLGYLPTNQINVVDILAGAFMFIRHETLQKVGLLDEDYFMYGEDIDLSYRITQGGYKNYYFPNTTIIHYKGESTKKTSVNYVFVFYQAMIIFAQKHFSNNNAKLFSLLINLAIYFKAGVSIVANFFQSAKLFLLDAVGIYGLIYVIKIYWEHNHKYVAGGSYPPIFMWLNATVYTLFWLLGFYFANSYHNQKSIKNIFRGVLFGLMGISLFYAFSPEDYRFSRAIILLATMSTFMVGYLNRLMLYAIKFRKLDLALSSPTYTIIVGNKQEATRVEALLEKTKNNSKILGYVGITETDTYGDEFLGSLPKLKEIVKLFHVEEIIFCSKDISAAQIIECMEGEIMPGVHFKIVPEQSSFIIGSNSKNNSGEFYTLDFTFDLNKPENQRKKRVLDLAASVMLFLLSPILIWLVNQKINFLKNILNVFFGKKTWVGYASKQPHTQLPKIKTGVLNPTFFYTQQVDATTQGKINLLYAKNYSVEHDVQIILASINKLGN